jgi:RNA polymerase sporulation-specific sigma factor
LIERRLGALTTKQRHVLVRRFGLGGAAARTLADIARTAGISHQQAGMRERRALQRLETALAPLAAEWYGAV